MDGRFAALPLFKYKFIKYFEKFYSFIASWDLFNINICSRKQNAYIR